MSNKFKERGIGMNDLTDKIALVTGATRGIGQAILYALANEGAIVIGTSTTPNGAELIQTGLNEKGYKGLGYCLDVTRTEDLPDLISAIETKFGKAPDILVNNAAITRDNLLMRMKEEEWDAIIDTNLSPAFYLAKACVRAMLKARWGRIINIGSVSAHIGNPGQANYCAAKAGLVGLSKSLAAEVASRNITVNVVAPGFVDTDMTKALSDEQRQHLQTIIPVGRVASPDEIAAAVAFLASPKAGYITGQTIHVNGGMYMA